nr:hypothetical protein [uncultured Campylobacter sp.]
MISLAPEFDGKFDRFCSRIDVTVNLTGFTQNPHLENAGKFMRKFLMLANLSLAKFMSRKFKKIRLVKFQPQI